MPYYYYYYYYYYYVYSYTKYKNSNQHHNIYVPIYKLYIQIVFYNVKLEIMCHYTFKQENKGLLDRSCQNFKRILRN